MWCKYVSQFGLSSTQRFFCGGLPIVPRKSRHSTLYCGGPHECERPLRAVVLRIEGTERSILHLVRLKQVSQHGSSDYSGCSLTILWVLLLFWVFRSEDKRHCWCDAWLPLHNSSRPEPELLDYLDHLAPNRIFRISLCLLLRTLFALDRPALCVHPSPRQFRHKILRSSRFLQM